MLKLLKPGQDAAVQATEKAMVDHSNDGLRTLVVASRELEPEAYEAWAARYGAAMADVAEHEKKERDEPNEIDRLGAELEGELTLLGSTALEDKLQDGVPKCVADIARGGIALWVLTGDKEETAINIAFACQMLDTSTQAINEIRPRPSSRGSHPPTTSDRCSRPLRWSSSTRSRTRRCAR